MKSIYLFLAIILSFLTIQSCKTIEESNRNTISISERPSNIDSDMSISIKSEDISISGKAKVKIAGTDSLFMDISGPFGIKFGKLYADTNIFYFYNAMENTVLKGKPTADNIRRATYLNISAIDIINLFKNLPPSKEQNYREAGKHENGTLYQYKNEFLILNAKSQMIQYQRKNEVNDLELNIIYSEFNQYSNFEMPSSFLIDAPIAKSTVNISIKQMTFPAGFENAFKFSIPQSAKIIEL